eukprot:12437898-Alexandrium_andersonii.AAC.1
MADVTDTLREAEGAAPGPGAPAGGRRGPARARGGSAAAPRAAGRGRSRSPRCDAEAVAGGARA